MAFASEEKKREYHRQYYLDNKSKILAQSKKDKNKKRKWFEEFKSSLKCLKCGEDHPACLEFHHKDSSQKEFSISSYQGRGRDRLRAEIEKCEMLCSNCHKKLHWKAGF